MVIKLTKEQEKRLECICGLCDHSYTSTSCLYYKICDAANPSEEEFKQIKKLIAEVVAINIKKNNSATIAKKEVQCKTKKKNTSTSRKSATSRS